TGLGGGGFRVGWGTCPGRLTGVTTPGWAEAAGGPAGLVGAGRAGGAVIRCVTRAVRVGAGTLDGGTGLLLGVLDARMIGVLGAWATVVCCRPAAPAAATA